MQYKNIAIAEIIMIFFKLDNQIVFRYLKIRRSYNIDIAKFRMFCRALKNISKTYFHKIFCNHRCIGGHSNGVIRLRDGYVSPYLSRT